MLSLGNTLVYEELRDFDTRVVQISVRGFCGVMYASLSLDGASISITYVRRYNFVNSCPKEATGQKAMT